MQQPANELRRDRERRVGDDVERTAGEPQIASIGLHDDEPPPEPLAQLSGATVVQLEGDDVRAGCDQPLGERAGAGADVEDEVARSDAGGADESLSPGGMELVPAPVPRRSHGDGPS